MSIKDLFKQKSNKALSRTSISEAGSEIESEEFAYTHLDKKDRFIPEVDFSEPSNFAFYGSAKKYYVDSLERIQQTYPFDGSRKETLEWHNSSSYLDKYIFDNEYPRTNGYITLSPNGWGQQATASYQGFGQPISASVEYIQIKGGPNTGPSGSRVGANTLDSSTNRESNLNIDGVSGSAVEFWLKKDNIDTSKTQKEVIFDIWNSSSVSHAASSNYGRFLVYLDSNNIYPTSSLRVTYVSGAVSACTDQILGANDGAAASSSIMDNSWNHFAILAKNINTTDLQLKLYLNGTLNDTRTISAGAIGKVTGSLIANIGALTTKANTSDNTTEGEGNGKLSGSIDEFRYWKRYREPKNIQRHWFTQVAGGVESDTDANQKLGVYYKFNEGIVGSSSVDNKTLDYSGRISHGTWVGYENTGSIAHRQTGSAIVLASAATSEFKDPILYGAHPEVYALETRLSLSGSNYDHQNNSSIYNSFPLWVREEDADAEKNHLYYLSQIMGNYFDTLHLQIKSLSELRHSRYPSGSTKPYPFSNRLLESEGFMAPEIFADADVLAQFGNKDEDKDFSENLYDIKNLIYQNIYNNLNYIQKSKGTEKAFRNLIRCFGVDDELLKYNIYADNTTFTLNDNYRFTAHKTKCVDFNNTDRFGGTVYQYTDASNSNSVSFFSGSENASIWGTQFWGQDYDGDGDGFETNMGFTVETEVILPKKFSKDSPNHIETSFVSCSLFGMHSVETSSADWTSGGSTTWDSGDLNFQVYAVRDKLDSNDVYFYMTGSFINGFLTSSLYKNQYDNQRWNLAMRVKPERYPRADKILDADTAQYKIELYGANMTADIIQEEFSESISIPTASGIEFLCNAKRLYVGSHRTDFTGSLLQRSDAKVVSSRVWYHYLPDETLRAHARDASNFGVMHPYRNLHPMNTALSGTEVPTIDSLALHWDFNQVTASTTASSATAIDATFAVADVSSGSTDLINRYDWLGNLVNAQHTGKGNFFPGESAQVVDIEYINSAKQQLPEILDSDDMIQILSEDDETFTRETRPINYFFAIEKSMNRTISEEMMNMFATIKDFNNLIGEPVNRYRPEYKDLGKLRQLFFEKVQNTPDIEKYIEYYKWIDSSLSSIIEQLVPASANMSSDIRNVVESHILERNKYWTKFPTLEMKVGDIEGGAYGINRHKYDWKSGSAPIPLTQSVLPTTQSIGNLWYSKRAERELYPISTNDSDLDKTRALIHSASWSTLKREFTTPYDLVVNLPTSASDEIVPYNITNVKQAKTSSYINVSASNYAHDYEIVQTSDRSQNNKYLAISGNVPNAKTASVYLQDVTDIPKPIYPPQKHVFVEHFSAPGSPETAGDANGGPGLDPESGQFSVYNSLNYRNLSVRGIPTGHTQVHGKHKYLLSKPAGQFGIDSDVAVSSSHYDTPAAFHKQNRNNNIQVRESGSLGGSYVSASSWDNWYIQRTLPASDLGYRWISSSFDTAHLGFATASDDFKFVSGSEASGSDNASFAGFNSASLSGANAIFNSRNGSWGYPSFKQVRVGQTRDARYLRENNIYSIIIDPSTREINRGDGRIDTLKEYRGITTKKFIEPPISTKYKPIFHQILNEDEPVPIVYSHGNALSTFANTELAKRNGMTRGADSEIYRRMIDLYPDGEKETPIKEFDVLKYNETIYPREINTYLGKIRQRNNFDFQWRTNRSDRNILNKTNSYGFTVISQSMWGIDGRISSSTDSISEFEDGRMSEGELQNSYTHFLGRHNDEDPGLLGNSVNYVCELNGTGNLSSVDLTNDVMPDINDYNDCIVLGHSADYEKEIGTAGTNKYSLSMWLNVTSSFTSSAYRPEYQTLVEFGNTDRWFGLSGSDAAGEGNLHYLVHSCSFNTTDGSWRTAGAVITGGLWYNIAVTYDASSAANDPTFYINGVSQSSVEVSTPVGTAEAISDGQSVGFDLAAYNHYAPYHYMWHSSSACSWFGTSSQVSPAMYPFEGQVYGLGFWADEITAAESLEIYNNGYPKSLFLHSGIDKILRWFPLGDGFGYDDKTNGTAGRLGATTASQDGNRFSDDKTFYNVFYDAMGSKVLGNSSNDEATFYIKGFGYKTGARPIINATEVPKTSHKNLFVKNHTLRGVGNIGFSGSIKTAPTYFRRVPEYIGTPWRITSITGSLTYISPEHHTKLRPFRDIRITGSRVFAGDTKWTAPAESGKTPFYTSYGEYVDEIKRLGKDYSIIPEFRISEHMNYYINEQGGDFLKQRNEFLTLTGSDIASSSINNFYKTYSHSDFLKYFDVISQDHKNIADAEEIKLKCSAKIKFVPYNGFYPQQRTQQLATLFSQSYGDYVQTYFTASGETMQHTASWRAFTTSMFAPGILYNSIKSGMAVDFPIYKSYNAPQIMQDIKAGKGGGKDFLVGQVDSGRFMPEVAAKSYTTRGIYGSKTSASVNNFLSDYDTPVQPYELRSSSYENVFGYENGYPIDLDSQVEWYASMVGSFDTRVPFEGLVNPEEYLSKMPIWDMEPEFSGSLMKNYVKNQSNQAALWGGEGKETYKLAMHNFLAEVPNFFLNKGDFTSFVSKPIPRTGIVINEEDVDKYYGMDIIVNNSACKSFTDWRQRRELEQFEDQIDENYRISQTELHNIKGVHTQMYSRDSAFGPPWVPKPPSEYYRSGSAITDATLFTTYPGLGWKEEPDFANHSFAKNAMQFHHGYEPFTPAYFNGYGVARVLFKPFKGAGNYTLDDILSNLTVRYNRMPTDRTGFLGEFLTTRALDWTTLLTIEDKENFVAEKRSTFPHYGPTAEEVRNSFNVATSNWMQLSASLNLFTDVKVKKVTYEKGEVEDYEPISVEDETSNADSVWVIQPKWETPIFNFFNKTATAEGNLGTGSAAKGIWHQYGETCKGREGIWLSVSDLPDSKIQDPAKSRNSFASITDYLYDSDYGKIWNNRSENIIGEAKTHGSVVFYIKDKDELISKKLKVFPVESILGGFFGTNVITFVSGAPSSVQSQVTGSNWQTAKNLESTINTNGNWENYLTASAFMPSEHPWKDITSISEPIAAVQITLKMSQNVTDYPPPFKQMYIDAVSVFNPRSYPNFLGAGEEGKKQWIKYLESDGTTLATAASASGLEGLPTPESDESEKSIGSHVYFTGSSSPTYEVDSLADLLGFQKTQKRLGETAKEKVIKEAVVAVPYLEKDGEKEFFNISRRQVDIAIGKIKAKNIDEEPGETIVKMVNIMKDYVFPPRMDFITNESVNPFAMYIFEFKHTLTKQDLGDIWQNLMPEIGSYFKNEEVSISHKLLKNEFLKGNLSGNMRWMVFKVKQKAEWNYYAKTADSSDDKRFRFKFKVGSTDASKEAIPDYNYNYPYDYFSLVELAKLDSEITFKKKKNEEE